MSSNVASCKDCGGQISRNALACPHCGSPKKQKTSVFTWLVAIFFAAPLLMAIIATNNKPTSASSDADAEEISAANEARNARLRAEVECQQAVERAALRKFEWTDGLIEPKFSREGKTAKGELILQGDKFMAQNGFGAMNNQVYTCTINTDTQTVVDLQFRDGKL